LRVILALTIPVAAVIAVGITPVVGILGFDAAGTALVVWTARAYLLGLMGHSLLEISARAFYAQQNARTPLIAAALTTVTFIVLAILLGQRLGSPGIGLANALAFTGEAILLWVLLERRYHGVIKAGGTLVRALLAAVCSGVVVFLLMRLSAGYLADYGLILQVGAAAVAMGLGLLVALPFVWREVRMLVHL
jgi:putative peptidoglycan lipid II flippase